MSCCFSGYASSSLDFWNDHKAGWTSLCLEQLSQSGVTFCFWCHYSVRETLEEFSAGLLGLWAAWSCCSLVKPVLASGSSSQAFITLSCQVTVSCATFLYENFSTEEKVWLCCNSVHSFHETEWREKKVTHSTWDRWVSRILPVFCIFFFNRECELCGSVIFVCLSLPCPSFLCLDLPPLHHSDVEEPSEPFWPVLWRWWRPDCSRPPSLSTSLRSSSVLWMEPAWPGWPPLVRYTVLSKKFTLRKKQNTQILRLTTCITFICCLVLAF